MSDPYATQLVTLEQSIRTFAQEVRAQIDGRQVLSAVDYDVPYNTGKIIDGREMWGVIIDFGPLPNATSKAYLIPSAVTSVWGPPGERWVDTGNSFFYHPTTGESYPIPHTSEIDFKGGTVSGEQVAVKLTPTEVIVSTQSDRTDFHGILVLKYILAATP